MAVKPILFSTDMVRAILEGRKTQTRRVLNPQPKTHFRPDKRIDIYERTPGSWEVKDKISECGFSRLDHFKCPFGKVGDLLYVRETFSVSLAGKEIVPIFKADWETACPFQTWRPSIHMPKKYARIWLEITNVRVERLNHITELDARNEGIETCIADKKMFGARASGMRLFRDYCRKDNSLVDHPCNGFDSSKTSFMTLWESIYGIESWEDNPWVWVVEFNRIDKPQNV